MGVSLHVMSCVVDMANAIMHAITNRARTLEQYCAFCSSPNGRDRPIYCKSASVTFDTADQVASAGRMSAWPLLLLNRCLIVGPPSVHRQILQ